MEEKPVSSHYRSSVRSRNYERNSGSVRRSRVSDSDDSAGVELIVYQCIVCFCLIIVSLIVNFVDSQVTNDVRDKLSYMLNRQTSIDDINSTVSYLRAKFDTLPNGIDEIFGGGEVLEDTDIGDILDISENDLNDGENASFIEDDLLNYYGDDEKKLEMPPEEIIIVPEETLVE